MNGRVGSKDWIFTSFLGGVVAAEVGGEGEERGAAGAVDGVEEEGEEGDKVGAWGGGGRRRGRGPLRGVLWCGAQSKQVGPGESIAYISQAAGVSRWAQIFQ